jgi:hypothetical protein
MDDSKLICVSFVLKRTFSELSIGRFANAYLSIALSFQPDSSQAWLGPRVARL